jgi:hypothetical protein
MSLPSISDLSVYQLAVETLVSPSLLRVSPATLESLVGALIDVLIEEKISATLWVKLPLTDGCPAELKRYQQVNLAQRIYLCLDAKDDLVQVKNGLGQATNVNGVSEFFPVQLVAGNQLKREYFFIVLCEQFSSLIVAERLSQPEPVVTASHASQPLLAFCTFEREVIQRVCEGIREAIAVNDTIPQELLEPWETRLPLLAVSDEKALLTQLLIKQVQRTDDLLHTSTTNNAQSVCNPVLNAIVSSDRVSVATPTSSSDIRTGSSPSSIDKLRKKDELLNRVAQELRTPLASMKTALRLLDSAQLKPAQRQRYMQLLYTECDRQNSLIIGFLELVKLDNEPQPAVMPSVQLIDIVPGVVSTYQPIAQEKGIQLGYTIPANLPPILFVETWLRQILNNLLNNSLKFTLTGGEVKVRAIPHGDYIQLAVSDTGMGIATNEIPRIFDSFYRGRSTPGESMGAGLGLAIVRQLLLRCGGSISVTSTVGEGSTFKVLLPIASTVI